VRAVSPQTAGAFLARGEAAIGRNDRGFMLWNWLNCYLSGRHDYGVSCASGSIFLRCIHCGKRSNGWAVHNQPVLITPPVQRQLPAKALRPLPFAPREVARPQQSA
jgi:hypothetical protein